MLALAEIVEKLRQRTWYVDFFEMELGQGGPDAPPEYRGPGYLRQEADGSITFKVYPQAMTDFNPRNLIPKFSVAGQILGAEFFHHLKATDGAGNQWWVDRTLVSRDTKLVPGRAFQMVTGPVFEISTSRRLPQAVSALKMIFFTEERVPGNQSTEITTVTPDGGVRKSSKLDTAQFSTAFGDFNIYNRPGMIQAEVVSHAPFPPHFETRITEALGFALAKPLDWNAIELTEAGTETVRLRGGNRVIDAKLPPPIVSGTIDMSGGDIWRLFGNYLSLVCTHDGDDFHPCSRHVFSVLEASEGAISARGLALGVAVEALTKDLYPDAGALPPTLKPLVKQVRKHFRAWEGFNDPKTKVALYERIETMLGKILDVSAKSKMYALEKEKVITERHIKAWSDLRNASAHGVSPGSDDMQVLVDLCDRVTVLMYHLIFRAVGYEGRYPDYSNHGWDKRYYRGRPVTEEEIAVAAYYLWEKSGRPDGHDVEHWLVGKSELEQGLY